jgi:superfamily II DNA or RNA helicase
MIDKLKDELQSKALKAFVDAGSIGTLCLETGTGKSRAATLFIHDQDDITNVLITSPRTNLKKNWYDELVKWGFEPWRDGLWTIDYDGERPSRTLNIEMENIQTCYKWTDRKYDFVILDEIHTIMTPEYSKLLENNEFKYILGLTATHDITDDNDKQIYYDRFCPIVYEYYNSAEDGLINKTRFFIVNHNLSDEDRIIVTYRGKDYERGEKEYYDYLTERMKKGQELMMAQGSTDWFRDARLWFWQGRGTTQQKGAAAVYMNAIKARKNFLLNLPSTGRIAKRISGGIRAEMPNAKVLVFSEFTAQADKISKYTVHSKNSDKLNAQLIEKFNDGRIKELGSCNSLTLGLNLVGATHAIMESYIGSATKSKQKKGRLDRLAVDEHADMWIIRVPGTQSDKWFKNMTKKFDLSEAVYLNSDFILRNDFDYRKSEIKTKVAIPHVGPDD